MIVVLRASTSHPERHWVAGMDTNREPEDQQREVAPVQALDGIVYEHVFRGLFVQWFRTQNPSNRCTEQY